MTKQDTIKELTLENRRLHDMLNKTLKELVKVYRQLDKYKKVE